MTPLREAVEALPSYGAPAGTHGSPDADAYWRPSVSLAAVLAIIDAHECVPDVERLAAAMNDAQVRASEIQLGRDLTVPAARIIAALGKAPR